MNKDVFHMTTNEREQCPECDSHAVRETLREQKFIYGTGDRAVQLAAKMPVFECQHCGFTFTDDRADKARQEAICRHEGVFTPEEIATVRKRADMSRTTFAAVGRFGVASLARWETGALLQNGANDQLIYLMQFPSVRAILMARRQNETLLPDETVRERLANTSGDWQPMRAQHGDRQMRRRAFKLIPDSQRSQFAGHRWKLRAVPTP